MVANKKCYLYFRKEPIIMFKKITIVMCICILFTVLTGCFGGSRPTGNEEISTGESMTPEEWNAYRDSLIKGNQK